MQRIKRILVPIDFSEGAERALDFAATIATSFTSEITLLHVGPADAEEVPETTSRRDVYERIRRQRHLSGVQKLEHTADSLRTDYPELEVNQTISDGVAWQVICDKAIELRADLIVMGTHGHRGLSHLLIGSTTERVVRESRVPVLTVRLAQ